MSTAGISFGGLASGLDTQAIISALLAVEQRPIVALEEKKTSIGRQKSLFGDLDGLLNKLTDAARALKTTSGFLQMTATSDNEAILTASADSSATPGTYTAEVLQLAKSQINTAGSSSPSDNIGGDSTPASFIIQKDGQFIPIASAPTLDAIAAAINAADEQNDLGLRAEVIDTQNPDPANRYQLVVRGDETGSENAFDIIYDDGSAAFQGFIDDLNTDPVDAQDAQLRVDGVVVYRQTNTINDLWGGITLDLKSAPLQDPGPPPVGEEVTVTVATDATETSTKITDLVEAYNELVDFFEAQNALDEEGNAQSPLFGDTTLRSIRSSLRNILGGSVTETGNPAYQLLSQIGIDSDTQGRLTFTQSEFEQALNDDETAVTSLFTSTVGGIAGRLEDQIDIYTDSVDGLLKVRTDSFDRLQRQTQNRIDQAEQRLARYEQQLTQRYANLETLLARLQGQGSSIGNIGQGLSGA